MIVVSLIRAPSMTMLAERSLPSSRAIRFTGTADSLDIAPLGNDVHEVRVVQELSARLEPADEA